MKPATRWWGLLLVALVPPTQGCTKYARRVPDKLLEKLPYEYRIELLEAENDLALAIDRLDESRSEILRARDALRRAKSRLDAADDEVGRADDQVSREVAELAVTEAEARVDFLRARQRLNVENEGITELALRCAFARFEAARLTVARKAKVEGSESMDPADFDDQVKACDAEVAERRAELKEDEAEANAAKDQWEKHKAELARRTFDARASPYVE